MPGMSAAKKGSYRSGRSATAREPGGFVGANCIAFFSGMEGDKSAAARKAR